MIKQFILILFFNFLFLFPKNVFAVNSVHSFDAKQLLKWTGRYPFERMHGNDLFQLNLFNDQVRNLLSKNKYKEYKEILNNMVSVPIELHENYLRFTICKAHHCDHVIHFFINLEQGKLTICEFTTESEFIDRGPQVFDSAIWYTFKGNTKVYNQGCEVYNNNTSSVDWKNTFAQIYFKD